MVWKTYYYHDFNKINYESLNITKLNFKRILYAIANKILNATKICSNAAKNNNNTTNNDNISQRIFNDIINN